MVVRYKSKKYSELTILFGKWLFTYVDRFYWGEFDEEDLCPKFIYTKLDRQMGYHPTRLTKTHIQEHIQGKSKFAILYYTTRAKSTIALLMIDIDAHMGQQNARDVAEWILSNYFPCAYYEPSTGGQGIHLYLLVEIKKNGRHIKRSLFNAYIEDFGEKLAYLVDDEFMAGTFETANVCGICGTVTCRVKKESKEEIHNGKLGKIPKPQSLDEVKRLINMPVYTLEDLDKVLNEAEDRRLEKENTGWQLTTRKSPRTKRRKLKVSSKMMKIDVNSEDLSGSLWDDDPRKRAFNTVIYLWQRTGQEPSVTEVLDLYEELGLGTGADINNRRVKRIADAITKVGQEYNPEEYSTDVTDFDYEAYEPTVFTPVLKKRLTVDDLKGTGYKGVITYTDLDLCASIIMAKILKCNISDEHRFCSLSSTLIARIFGKAKEWGIVKSKDHKKIRYMKDLLEQAELFEIDRSWICSGQLYKSKSDITDAGKRKNRGNIFRPTPQNPRYDEFVMVEQKHKQICSQREAQKASHTQQFCPEH
ncbi:MAG: TOTE conflict system archaeo-eukaryotic primase domain-containing protein [Planctomycetota bacterium]|jgi:hypothetical protein